jgi:hypothetical protein
MNSEHNQAVTLETVRALIDARIDERMAALRHLYHIDESGTAQFLFPEQHDTRTLAQLFETIEQRRWTPPPGAKSSVELIREDRDR